MVFKYNKLPFEHDDSIQRAFHHVRQLDCGGQVAFSAHRHIPEKRHFPDELTPGSLLKFEDATDTTSNDNCGSVLKSSFNLSWVITSNDDNVRSENSKRPLGVEENLQVAAKRPRQLDGNFPPISSTLIADDLFTIRKDTAVFEGAKDSHGSSSFSFQLFTCSKSDEDTRVEPPVSPYPFPGYYEDHFQPVQHNQVEETYSPLFNYHPRKPVSLGPDHQVEIPVWRPKSFQKYRGDVPDASTSSEPTNEDNSDKWIGVCVIPMPDSDSLGLKAPVGRGRTGCHCLDEGSIRCVRQHVMEARDELRSNLGSERFLGLGFCNMGEDVALEWTEEDEQLFNGVVMSNPASLGKNFWDYLPCAFPSRSPKELVSYYFNVFMLRKRAGQNRFDQFNVDSDNDEWQESYDGEFREEEDSGVESPSPYKQGDGEVDIHEGDYFEDVDYRIPEEFVCYSTLEFAPTPRTGEDQDVNDGSCTSFESQPNESDSH